ncbi:OmpW/AlkL family protein [Alloalcanivorax xenomutans]|uniref:OmpW/AlkL family protein n=1 Tax=Alloalcanivorax xenomutans TaxID=1094342 RepID=UPI00300ADBA4
MQLWGRGALALALIGSVGLAQGYEAGDILVRAGAATVSPRVDSDAFSVAPLTGAKVDVNNDTQFGFTVAYMINSRFGVELLAATPFKHDLYVGGAGLGRTDIGDTKHLPPTLMAQYYLPELGPVRPYVGLGVNYTYFFDENIHDGVVSPLIGGANADVSLSNSVGWAAQVGVDLAMGDTWFVNLSAWRVDIDTEARLKVNGSTVDKIDVELDPLVWMVGLGRAF